MSQAKFFSGRSEEGNHADECLICFRKKQTTGNLFSLLRDDDPICADCRSKLLRRNKVVYLKDLKCRILYEYNDAFSALLIQYKELCDEALYPVFLSIDAEKLARRYRGYTLVCPPSSEKKRRERGFDHVEKMFSVLSLPILSPFYKVDDFSQKKGGKIARQHVGTHIRLQQDAQLPESPILLIDDVVTSGNTLLSCYELLKKEGREIEALCVSGSHTYFE